MHHPKASILELLVHKRERERIEFWPGGLVFWCCVSCPKQKRNPHFADIEAKYIICCEVGLERFGFPEGTGFRDTLANVWCNEASFPLHPVSTCLYICKFHSNKVKRKCSFYL